MGEDAIALMQFGTERTDGDIRFGARTRLSIIARARRHMGLIWSLTARHLIRNTVLYGMSNSFFGSKIRRFPSSNGRAGGRQG
jgi:hypothetical protein